MNKTECLNCDCKDKVTINKEGDIMSKLKLTGIELKTKEGQKVSLSIDEAKDLHKQLDELFGVEYIPSTPIYIERDRFYRQPTRYYPEFWYSNSVSLTSPSRLEATYSLSANE